MARIAGVDVPNNKQVRIGLTYIFGIGDSRAAKILAKADVDPFAKISTLDEDQLNRIRHVIEQEGQIEGDLAIVPLDRRDVAPVENFVELPGRLGDGSGERVVNLSRRQSRIPVRPASGELGLGLP